MRLVAAFTTVLGLVLPASAKDFDLGTLLAGVEKAGRTSVALRGIGSIRFEGIDRTLDDRIVFIRRPNGDLYVALRESGVEAIVPHSGEGAVVFERGWEEPKPFAADAALAGTDLWRADLEAFIRARFQSPRIADRTGHRVTVTMTPRDSPYILLVVTFDARKHVPLKTLYYRETQSNVVKLRRDGEHQQVREVWLPGEIHVEHLQLHTETDLELLWSEMPEADPDLFDPERLPALSGIDWREAP